MGVGDITTVYKFNTFGDGESVKYLNTCIAASFQENDQGLPLFNITADTPLPESTIPPLYDGHNATRWELMMNNGTTVPILVPDYANITSDYSESLFQSDFSFGAKVEGINRGKSLKTKTAPRSTDTLNLFTSNEIVNTEQILLRVTFQRTPQVIIKLIHEEHYILITLDSVLLSACYYHKNGVLVTPCYEGTGYSSGGEINFFITLKSELFIYDQTASKVHVTNVVPNGTLSSIKQERGRYVSARVSVTYTLMQSPSAIASPWLPLKNNTSLIIFHENVPGYDLNMYVEEQNTYNQLKLHSQALVRKYTLERMRSINRILSKVNVAFPEDWTNYKRIKVEADSFVFRIGNIWEETYLDTYKIIKMAKPCEKSELNKIYNTRKYLNTNEDKNSSICFNGGSPVDITCSCPPGFAGKQCEIQCDRNHFGHKCSKMCSTSSNECKGMVLCTSYYGCSCATGYQGEQCLEHCPEGYYGADCKEKCGQCVDGCDQYTGACRGGCTTPYLIWPACKYSHSYLKLPPIVLNSSFNTVDLHIDLTPSNIGKSYDHTIFYRVQYREYMNETWNNGPYEEFNSIPMNTTIDGLKPGTIYLFRVLLIDETLETHDPDLTKSVRTKTKCTVLERENYINVNSVTNTSISLTWNEDSDSGAEECPSISYILEIEKTENGYLESLKIADIRGNSYKIETLSPGQTYCIILKKNTIYGESTPISNINVTTDDTIDFSIGISGVTVKETDSGVDIKWFQSWIYKTYYIKYKLIRYLACNKDVIESPLQTVTTSDTSYTLHYLEPNAQYQLFVTADKNQNMKAHNLTFITSRKVPDISPTLLAQKFKVTNESADLYWTDFSLSCQHMNGFFKKYNIELHDTQDNSLHMYETKNNHLEMTGLRPQTQYTVKVRYVNHIGFNRLIYVEHNFTTKATPVFEVQELTAYKTSPDVIGLRWKMPETNYTITKISIQLHSDIWNKTIDMDMTTPSSQPSSFQCKPWPSYICLDVTELKQNTKYRITVDVFSKEFPEGNPSQAINTVTRETMPSAVSDIKMSISDTNKTLSWRIPDLLNGILRKFVIEVEHLSSFDETLCCQNIVVIDYTVASEQEIYSHILQDMKNASSYQITIRPFTKRLGPEARQIFEIPPPHIPINKMPRVEVDGVAMVWSQTQTSHAEESSTEYSALASDILIIVHELNEGTNVTSEVLGFRNDMNHILNSNNWWVTHVCAAHDDNCSVDIDAEEGEDREDPDYGQVLNKPLLGGNSYRIVVVQVNKYLSARSYTVVMSKQFQKINRVTW
ncbi:hypothetical protein M8J75_004158 [Diaphorina citri]|nr:hypothetical protein M8J75_004158 [Diaphorina citri]